MTLRKMTIVKAPFALLLLLVLLLVTVLSACGGDGRQSPILALSADESLVKGKELLEAKKYFQAREYLTHAFEIEPNSVSGREALLLVADAHFFEGGSQNFIKAEAKYRDFVNRFPTSDKAPYVQYQIATSLLKRMRTPDRDQSISLDALEAYRDLTRLFPSSSHVEEARQRIGEIRGSLAEAEYLVGVYNFRRGKYVKCGVVCFEAAIARLEGVLKEYPGFQANDKVYFHLAVSNGFLGRSGKVTEYSEKLSAEYPQSEFLGKLEKNLAQAAKKFVQDQRKLDRAKAAVGEKSKAAEDGESPLEDSEDSEADGYDDSGGPDGRGR